MKKFAFISDIIFTFFVCFLFTLCLFRYVGVTLLPALLLATLCGALTAFAVGSILQYRRKTYFLKRTDESQKQKLLLHLALLSDEKKTEFFKNALSLGCELPVNRFGRGRIYTQEEFYFLKFPLAPVTADEIASLSRLKTKKKKILLCAQIEDAAFSLCNRLDIEVRTGEWVYTFLKSQNALPTSYLGEASAAVKNKRRFRLWFSRSNAKRFLACGALILLFSRLTPFYYYYLLLGVLLLIAAVFVRIFGYE